MRGFLVDRDRPCVYVWRGVVVDHPSIIIKSNGLAHAFTVPLARPVEQVGPVCIKVKYSRRTVENNQVELRSDGNWELWDELIAIGLSIPLHVLMPNMSCVRDPWGSRSIWCSPPIQYREYLHVICKAKVETPDPSPEFQPHGIV